MDRKEIEDLLFEAASAQAVSRSFKLGEGAAQMIREHAGDAADRILARGADEAQRRGGIEQGKQAFRTVVETMIAARPAVYRDRPGHLRDNLIGEDTFSWAKDKLCPGFWPFC